MTATATAPVKTRATYGFKLELPQKFTIRGLLRQKRGTIEYITIYKRVEKGLKNGEIVVTGKQEPKTSRKGRKELVYSRVNAKTTALTATKTVEVMSDLV